jgi:ABC-2 type transport system ATP-binding protein
VVTHAADLVRQVCDRAVVLDHGAVVAMGPPGESVRAFRETLVRRGIDPGRDRPDLRRDYGLRITDVDVAYPEEGRTALLPGEPLTVTVSLDAATPLDDVVVALEVYDPNGNRLVGTNTDLIGVDLGTVSGAVKVDFRFGAVPLLDGTFDLALGVHTHDGGLEYDHREGVDSFSVMNPGRTEGLVHLGVDVDVRGTTRR